LAGSIIMMMMDDELVFCLPLSTLDWTWDMGYRIWREGSSSQRKRKKNERKEQKRKDNSVVSINHLESCRLFLFKEPQYPPEAWERPKEK